MQQPTHVKKEPIFFYLLLLTAFFALIEISFFIMWLKAYLGDFSFMSSNMQIPITIAPGILYFIFSQILIHVGYCGLVWLVTYLIAELLQLNPKLKFFLAISIWAYGLITIFVANAYFFPNSKFALLINFALTTRMAEIMFFLLGLGCSFIFFIALIAGFTILYRKSIFYPILFVVFSLNILMIFVTPNPDIPSNVATPVRPNIILVGVDSLRPDFLSYFGYSQATPFFDIFLQQATVFTDAVTPIARTFPSWTSLLTGKYPRENGVRFNLADKRFVDLEQTLPAILKRHGYETVFATDETRFSNIDTKFGFDQLITPPTGLNDFLIGTFNDFPVSNLLVNTFVGAWLFPYSYANRPVFTTYDPNTFLTMLRPYIEQKKTKPVFLAAHFCLTHYPYLWANSPASDNNIVERYVASVDKVDWQLAKFFKMLKSAHLLDHAVVVLLSDHGEALELPGDRITEEELFSDPKHENLVAPKFYPPSLDNEGFNQSAGHGTDVLGIPQYHSLLAFKFFGLNGQKKGDIQQLVSLMDIKPTILGLLGITNKDNSGVSLAKIIYGKKPRTDIHQDLFIESDYSPEALRTVYPETRKLLLEGVQLFQIDAASTRLTVKPSMGKMIISSKQYADIRGEWMLALYPQNQNLRMPILINLRTGEWTDDLSSKFATHSPAKEMFKKLKTFYGSELE